MNELDVVVAYAGAWSAWQDEADFPFGPKHCVNGTRVAVDALRHFDVVAKPMSVEMLLFNRFAWDLWHDGVAVADWPVHAWSLGVGASGPVSSDDDGEDNWTGHLMCEGAGWTLDVSARQFDRPGRIVVDEPLVMPLNLPRRGQSTFTDGHGQRLIIGRWPQNNRWRWAGGWRRQHTDEIAEIVQRTKALLGQ